MTNTALRAEKEVTRTITFKSKEYEKIYQKYLQKCRYQDVYHKALVYCLGIDRDTKTHADKIYNFKTGNVKTKCQRYSVEDLFCCGYARYFWEAVKIRYPEYCFYVDWEDRYVND